MTDAPFPNVAVLGGGSMGHGIAELVALSGRRARVRDVDEDILAKAEESVAWSLDKLVESGRITEAERDAARSNLTFTLDLEEAVADADLVVEAVPENLELKQKVWKEVEGVAPPEAVFATNTSSLTVTDQAKATGRPSRMAGLHFFNPPVKMQLVEVVRGEQTADGVVEDLVAFVEDLGKDAVVVEKDVPGFLVNRVIGIYMVEAAWLLDERAIDKEALDAHMKFHVGFPMGPFELLDYTGLDIAVHASESTGQDVPSSIRGLVEQGDLGKKTGSGFYDWSGGGPKLKPDQGEGVDPWPVLAPAINSAAWLVQEGIADAATVDRALRLGTGWPDGPLAMCDEAGADAVVAHLEDHPRYPVTPLLAEMAEEGETFHGSGVQVVAERAGVGEGGLPPYETVRATVSGGVATVTLDRPDRLNTLNQTLMEELEDLLGRLAGDDDVRVLVLRGAGPKAFCAGADVTSFVGVSPTFMISRSAVFDALAEFPKPTIAAIHGYCMGGGLELALACDFRIARDDARIGQTEVNLGLIPGGGGTQRLVAHLGLAKAKELVLLGEKLSAEEADAYGLLTEVASKDDFDDAVAELAGRLADGPPIALRAAKMLLDRAGGPDPGMLEAERLAFGIIMGTEDVAEGVSAFLSKSKPEFKGK